MGYFKRVAMEIEEAIAFESSKGFESRDEFYEVMREIASVYDVTLANVLEIFYNQDMKIEA